MCNLDPDTNTKSGGAHTLTLQRLNATLWTVCMLQSKTFFSHESLENLKSNVCYFSVTLLVITNYKYFFNTFIYLSIIMIGLIIFHQSWMRSIISTWWRLTSATGTPNQSMWVKSYQTEQHIMLWCSDCTTSCGQFQALHFSSYRCLFSFYNFFFFFFTNLEFFNYIK